MPLKLMYITNIPKVALIAEKYGVDRIFVDMEYIGKSLRQGGMDSVQNHHTAEDVRVLRKIITTSELVVRVNPIHEKTELYPSSEAEIDEVVSSGADIIMLPYFKTADEVRRFVKCVGGRCRTTLLLETPEAAEAVDEILEIPGIDEIHIGINDMCIGMGKQFMFQLLVDGTVERLCRKMELQGRFYGFGGIASLGQGLVPAELVIKEHYRLGSRAAILSRAFCNTSIIRDLDVIEEIFSRCVREIRELERECEMHMSYFTKNREELRRAIAEVVK